MYSCICYVVTIFNKLAPVAGREHPSVAQTKLCGGEDSVRPRDHGGNGRPPLCFTRKGVPLYYKNVEQVTYFESHPKVATNPQSPQPLHDIDRFGDCII